jgi:glycosyltransferase involved in cell wall biosynthesis
MRVLHICRGFQDYICGLINAQAEIAEVHFLVAQRDAFICSRLNGKVRVHLTRLPATRSLGNAWRLPSVASLIRKINPDVVHMQSGLIWEYALAFGRRRCPFVLTVHDVLNHPARGLMLDRTPEFITAGAVRSADAVIVHGDSLRELALDRFRFRHAEPRVYSVPHGVISEYGTGAARPVVPPGTGNVLFFGFLQKNKGLEYLVESEPILRKSIPNVSIVVAGSASNPSYYRNLFSNSPGIDFRMGHHDRRSVEQLFRWADVVVLPYIEASQSGVFQIATAFGVPVVASRVGGFRDVIRHAVNGLLTSPRDPVLLAAAIEDLLSDSTLRARMIAEIQSERLGRFSWSSIAWQTLGIYNESIARFRRANEVTTDTAACHVAPGESRE